ncbi:hypothetical protein, partial [Lentibacter algarum]|uniref:hypothetical protein n=1 Tax=Lentibacter algarum TaxID=576131 RepID=UPI0035C792B8
YHSFLTRKQYTAYQRPSVIKSDQAKQFATGSLIRHHNHVLPLAKPEMMPTFMPNRDRWEAPP